MIGGNACAVKRDRELIHFARSFVFPKPHLAPSPLRHWYRHKSAIAIESMHNA